MSFNTAVNVSIGRYFLLQPVKDRTPLLKRIRDDEYDNDTYISALNIHNNRIFRVPKTSEVLMLGPDITTRD